MKPKISIIVPVFNTEQYLDDCVSSIVNQSLRNIEIILVDDASTDSSPKMCDDWAKKDARIKVVHKKKNEGLGFACNTGIEIAAGEYLAFCDSDDWVDSCMYEKMLNAAIINSCDIVFSGLKSVDINGIPIGHLPHRTSLELYTSHKEICLLAKDMIASAPSVREERTIQMSAKVVLYKHSIIKNNKIRFVSERETLSEDLHFNLCNLAYSRRTCVLPDCFYYYRRTSNSITRKVDPDKFQAFKKLLEFTMDEVEHLKLGHDAFVRVQRMFLGYIRFYLTQIMKSDLDFSSKKTVFENICTDVIFQKVLRQYPITQMPLSHSLFSTALKYKSFFFTSLLVKFK